MATFGLDEVMTWQRRLRQLWCAVTRSEPDQSPNLLLGQPAVVSDYDLLLNHLRQYGTANGLDLSNANLEGAILDHLNLDGIKLGDYSLRRGARLARASLQGTSLRDADLSSVDCTDAKMRRVDLTRSNLAYAILDRADLRWATLVEADLYRSSLSNTILSEANLQHADLYFARLENTQLRREDLHPPLLHENRQQYALFLNRLSQRRNRPMDTLSPPLERALEIYRSLRTNWRSIGRGDDASWAYVREKRAERTMHSPWQSAEMFARELRPQDRRWRPIALIKFYLRHTLFWLSSWFADLTCGYGERPWHALGSALCIILLFPFLYCSTSGIATIDHQSSFDYLIYSIGAFCTVGFSNYKTLNWQADLLTSIEGFLGIALFALVMFTLGNRLSRL